MESYEIGMLKGDTIYAMLNLYQYLIISFRCGRKLQSLAKDFMLASHRMVQFKQDATHSYILPAWQAVLNLMGLSDHNIKLTGHAMNEESFLQESLQNDRIISVSNTYQMALFLGVIFGENDYAMRMAAYCRKIDRFVVSKNDFNRLVFYEGLAALDLARRTKLNSWKKIAMDSISHFTEWSQASDWNFNHNLLLLRAELFFLENKLEYAAKSYDEAIKAAKEHRFLNDEALANEKAALFHKENGNKISSAEYLDRAQQCYDEWGAVAKVDHIRNFSENIGLR